ncbi:AzlD domain-containing protein [Nitrogeniibacter mangrovi]|uniref:AzlD domain-containing protein n=2 Tax=Nitrogeniibacter mangrovi TaxID=2016596 RepID=A0A6C1AZP8_9RHOO|nr:AzlD domain-containing protein [Nitrogeniibacter mangrovi]QID16836.1 AzlD domain-containing protein [Nitrogeniibacter mangrovi]
MDGAWIWLAFALVSLATHGPRGSFIVLGHRARLPEALREALRYAPAAALAAIVMPNVLVSGGAVSPFNPKVAAAVVVVGVALRSKNPWLPFLLGMGVLLLLRKGLGL